jgi:hypothetical protein
MQEIKPMIEAPGNRSTQGTLSRSQLPHEIGCTPDGRVRDCQVPGQCFPLPTPQEMVQ